MTFILYNFFLIRMQSIETKQMGCEAISSIVNRPCKLKLELF